MRFFRKWRKMKCMRLRILASKLIKSITKNSLPGESLFNTSMITEKLRSATRRQKRFKRLGRNFKKNVKEVLLLMKSLLIK
jgi:hypothetical protein